MAMLEQMLQQLLAVRVTDAIRGLAHARALESFALLTALQPQLAQAVIEKVRQAAKMFAALHDER